MTRVLDTDHMTVLERGGIGAVALEIRLAQVPPREVATTIISYEEQMRGWLSRIAQAKTNPEKVVAAYDFLRLHIETYQTARILDYDSYASNEYERLRGAGVRVSTKDLRIAAICISVDATLLTRNLRHFEQVPGLKFEDWSV